jgi:hypothetical protein
MYGRSQHAKTVRRLVVWGVLVAFCVTMVGETALASLHPWGNQPRDISRVQVEVDEDPFSIDRMPAVDPPILWRQLAKLYWQFVRPHSQMKDYERNTGTANQNQGTPSNTGVPTSTVAD